MTETARTLGRYAHAIYDVWMRDPERHFGDHAMAQIVADLLTALAAEEYDQASTLLVCVDGASEQTTASSSAVTRNAPLQWAGGRPHVLGRIVTSVATRYAQDLPRVRATS